MSRFIIHNNGKVLDAFETKTNEYTLEYPPHKVQAVEIDDKLWQSVVENPKDYTYKDGQVKPVDT